MSQNHDLAQLFVQTINLGRIIMIQTRHNTLYMYEVLFCFHFFIRCRSIEYSRHEGLKQLIEQGIYGSPCTRHIHTPSPDIILSVSSFTLLSETENQFLLTSVQVIRGCGPFLLVVPPYRTDGQSKL